MKWKKIKSLNKLFLYCIVFVILFFIFYTPKLVVDSNLDLMINPQHAITHFLWGWNNLLLFGQSYSGNYTYIFPFSFMYWLFSQFTNIHFTQALIFSLLLFTGFFSFSLFIQEELKSRSWYIYVGSLFYIFNLYTLTLFSGGSVLLLPYFILPLQLYFLRKILIVPNYLLPSFGFAFSTLIMTGINPPLIAINLIVIFFYILHLMVNHKEIVNSLQKSAIRLVFAFISTLLLNLYWIIGVLVYYYNLSKVSFESVLSEPLSMQNSVSTYLNVLRTLGLWSFGQGYSGLPYYNYANIYLYNPLFILSLYAFPIFAVSGLVYYKEKVKQNIFLLLLLLLAIPMVVGSNQGLFKDVYIWSYSHVPLFSMFRSGYKFISVYIFCLCFFFVFIIHNIKNKKWQNIIATCLTLLILLNAFPFFTHRIFEKNKLLPDVPQYYYQAKNFFDHDTSEYRIFLLPEQYFSAYTWGFAAANVEILWNKGLVARQAGSALEPSNKKTLELYQALFSENYPKANSIMDQLNVKYIVLRNDFDWEYYKGVSHSPQKVVAVLSPYKKVASFGQLLVYKAPAMSQSIIRSKNVKFKKISPVEYKISIKNIKNNQRLLFLESFDKNWKLFLNKRESTECNNLGMIGGTSCSIDNPVKITDVVYAWEKPIFDTSHSLVFSYANQWTIDPQYIIANYSPKYFSINKDGSINIELTMYFKSQAYLYGGIIISVVTAMGMLGYFIYRRLDKKYAKQ